VAVLSNNDGCVISRSNELKALGVPMGMPFFQLRPLVEAHGIQVRSSNYELYADMSRRVMEVLAEHAPQVEQYSIDEAFLELRPVPGFDFARFGAVLRERVWKWVGIPVGVGFAVTRTLAKIANHLGKKSSGGVFVMPADPTPVLAELPVEEVWGVGRRSRDKLRRLGIVTAAGLAAADGRDLTRKFNVCLARTALELRGTPALAPEDMEKPAQTLTCSRSFGRPVFALAELREAVAYYIATAAAQLRKQEQLASGVNVFFQYVREEHGPAQEHAWGNTGATVMFGQPTAADSVMLAAIAPVLDSMFIPDRRYRKAGVMFFGLESAARRQLSLFADPNDARREHLYAAMDKINRQFGRGAVFHLAQGIDKPWLMRREHLSPCFTTKWSDILALNPDL
jgi:DNA polymerase V